MQDPYAGDVGDFGKFGLLRHLFQKGEGWALGVIWFLCHPEPNKNDGKYIGYLQDRRFAACDSDLHDALSLLVGSGNRCVAGIEQSGILERKTVFFSEVLDFAGLPAYTPEGRQRRNEMRQGWWARAMQSTAECGAIFLDPDNGIEVPSTPRHGKRGPKFIYYDEIGCLTSRGQVVVVYHHLNRHRNHGTHKQQICSRMQALRTRLHPTGTIECLRYSPYSPRAFFILSTKDRQSEISESIGAFMGTHWSRHFQRFTEPSFPES